MALLALRIIICRRVALASHANIYGTQFVLLEWLCLHTAWQKPTRNSEAKRHSNSMYARAQSGSRRREQSSLSLRARDYINMEDVIENSYRQL